MKTYLLIIALLFSTCGLHAQGIKKTTLIGSPTDNEMSVNLVADDAGNTYVGGLMNNKGLIVKQNALHQTIWSKTITFQPAASNNVSIKFLDILADTVFGCGMIQQSGMTTGTFYFKMNAQTGAFYWCKHEMISNGYLSSMRYANGKFFLVGGTDGSFTTTKAKVFAVSSQTGDLIWETPLLSYAIPGGGSLTRILFTSSTEMENGKMFISGMHTITLTTSIAPLMPVLVGISESGTIFMEKRVSLPFIPGFTMYDGTRIEYDMDKNILLACSNQFISPGQNNPNLILMKLDTLGNTIFSKDYEIDGEGFSIAFGLNETADSYVLSGPVHSNFGGLFVLKVDKNGELQKCIGIQKPNTFYNGVTSYGYGNSMFKNGLHYFATTEIAAFVNESNINQIIVDEELNTIEDCSELMELPLITTIPSTQLETMLETTDANAFVYQDGVIEENLDLYISCDSISLNLENTNGCQSLVTATIEGFEAPTFHWSDGTVSTSNTLSTNQDTVIVVVQDIRCCELTDTIVQIASSSMTISLPADTTLCLLQGNSITLNPEVTNPGSPVSYSWNDNSVDSTLSVTHSGIYWVNVSDNCITLRDSMLVTVVELPEITGLSDTSICEGNFPVSLVPSVSGSASVLWNSGATTIDLTVESAGQLTLQATNICGTVSATAVVTQVDLPEISLVASIDSCLHDGESIVLTPVLENVSATTWSDGTATTSLPVSGTGTYTVYGSNACGTDSASCVVVIREFPDLYLPPTLDTCFEIGTGFFYTAQGSSGAYQWNSGSQVATELITQEGLYICTLTNQCGSTVDSIRIKRLAGVDLFIPEDSLQMCKQQITVNLLQIETNYEYQLFAPWTGLPVGSDIRESGWYRIRAFNTCGEIWDSVYVDLQNEQTLYIPNTFTPNQDGINDQLELAGVNITITDLLIFNRWGEEIYSQEMPVNTWDGSYKGQPCPDGVYLVKVRYENCFGIPTEFNGHVSLLR